MRKIFLLSCLSLLLLGCSSPDPYHLTKMEYRGTTDQNGNKYDERYTLHFTSDAFGGRKLAVDVSKETYESCTLEKKKEVKDNEKD